MRKRIISLLCTICLVLVFATGCSFGNKDRLDYLEQQYIIKEELIAEQKNAITELEKKNTDQTAETEALKKKIADLEKKIKELEDNLKPPDVVEDGDLSIHFLELGNRFTGDSVYISYGGTDILIDAGSRPGSAATITRYIDNYITDGKLDYVIATHAHQDHIAGFYSSGSGSSKVTGVLDAYEIGTIIDYPRTNSTTVTRTNYETTRDRLVTDGDTVHYTALECYKEQNGAQRIYDIGPGVTLEILYNYYYERSASTENNYSVIVRIVQDGNQYLFTGDLEKDGEDKLVDYYETNYGGLGTHILYKGGHHGSSTSSNDKLLVAITPEYIIICTCAGTAEYQPNIQDDPRSFPTQTFIDRIAPYTDKVYVTTIITDWSAGSYESMNGDVIFLVKDGEISIIGSNNDTKLKDTDWFKTHRTMPAAWAE